MAALSPAKVELNQKQSYAILDNLSLLAFDAHKQDRLSYSPTSISLGTSSSTWRTVTWALYIAGSEVTPDLEALLPLITKVHNCIIKNPRILNEYDDRTACIGKVEKAVLGLEALKINQYQGYDKKQEQIDKSIDVLRGTKRVLETKREETSEIYREQTRQRIKEEEARQTERDARLAFLEQENKLLKVQAASVGNFKKFSAAQLIELAQDCLKLAAAEMKKNPEQSPLHKTAI